MSFLKNSISRGSKEFTKFIQDAERGNSIKYSAKAGNSDIIIFPYSMVETTDDDGNTVVNKSVINITACVHDGLSIDGKYRQYICMADMVEKDDKGNVIHDGTCPYCDYTSKAWDIANMLIARDVEKLSSSKMSNAEYTEKVKEIKSKHYSNMKIKERTDVMYVLIALINKDKSGEVIINEAAGEPSFSLKIWKISPSKADKIRTAMANVGIGIEGSEMIISYPEGKDILSVVGKSVLTPIVPQSPTSLCGRYPKLMDHINEEAQKFKFEKIESDFSEFRDVSTEEARQYMGMLFDKYDKYLEELKTNPNAQYLEYSDEASRSRMADNENEMANNGSEISDIDLDEINPNATFAALNK